MKKILKWFKSRKRHKYINGGKGVISIFLAIIMLPFLSLADILVESTRYHEATTILDDAMDSAALSTLSNYDKYLLDRFGLMAISQEKNMSTTYTHYLEQNVDDLTTFSISSEDVKATNSLADNDVLLAQIQDISKFSAPTALASDLGVSDLIEALEKMLDMSSFFTIATSTGEAVDSALVLAESVVELQKKATDYENILATYEGGYSNFCTSVEELKTAIKGKREAQEEVDEIQEELNNLDEDDTEKKSQLESDLEDAKETLKQAEADLVTAKKAFENARDTYASNIDDLKEKLSAYSSQIVTVMSNANELVSKVQSAATDIASASSESAKRQKEIDDRVSKIDEWLSMENLSETKREELNQEKKNLKAEKSNLEAAGKTRDAMVSSVQGANESYANDVLNLLSGFKSDVVSECISTLETLSNDVRGVMVNDITEIYVLDGNKYHKSISGVITAASIQELIDKEDAESDSSSFWSDMRALSSVIDNLFKTDLIYKSELSAYIADDCEEYKEGEIDLILNDISDLTNYFDNLNDGILGRVKMLLELKNLFTYLKNLCEHVINYVVTIATRAASMISEITSGKLDEKLYLNEYLIKCLPNRLNYDAGSNAYTGYKYSEIPYANCSEAEKVPIVGGIVSLIEYFEEFRTGGSDYMFCGAELEYILFGTKSEIINQSFTFFAVYLLRVLVDVVPICANPEVEAIATDSALVTLGFGYAAIMIMYAFLEPLIDTLLIVNDRDISFLKNVCYLTPSGLPSLLENITSLGLSDETKQEVTNISNEYINGKIKKGSSGSDSKGITWKYENYLFLFLFLSADMNTYLDRLQCLMAMESVAYYGDGNFNINNTYTCLEVTVNGNYNSILSLDSLAGTNLFEISRTRTRGY